MMEFQDSINIQISKEWAEKLVALLSPQKETLKQDMELKRDAFLQAGSAYDECVKMIQALQSLTIPTPKNGYERYSKMWKWPLKTMYALKQLKRPVTANEVLRAISMYEGGDIPEAKKTSVFTALTNFSKEGKIKKTKPGNEYAYSLPEFIDKGEIILTDELDKIEKTME